MESDVLELYSFSQYAWWLVKPGLYVMGCLLTTALFVKLFIARPPRQARGGAAPIPSMLDPEGLPLIDEVKAA